MKAALLALLLLASVSVPVSVSVCAFAATAEDVHALYARGEYEQAARAGEASHSAAGLATAARAVLADEVLRDAPCLPCLQRAESLARQAIAVDPHHAFGQVWLAVALGYQARITGAVKARLANSPAQSKAALDLAVKDEPGNAFAVSALGGWHIEIVRGGGSFLAKLAYGAREDEALALFDRAVKLAPDNVAIHYQIGLSLAGFALDKYRSRVTAEFKAAAASPPRTAYEKKIQERAGELLSLMDSRVAFDQRVRKYQGFPD
jgi:tetratricopeptide (TPR) repeat protein